jgi:hypothetical protein
MGIKCQIEIEKWDFECQKGQIQIARFTPFCWDIICKSQGFYVVQFLFSVAGAANYWRRYTFTIYAILCE